MIYKHELPSDLKSVATQFREFANGGAQVTVKLQNGRVFEKVLISDARAIIAIRGFNELPFEVEDISETYQSSDDLRPRERGNWEFWDDWARENPHNNGMQADAAEPRR